MELLDLALLAQEPQQHPIQLVRSITGNLSVAATLTLGRRDRSGSSTLLIESSEELQRWKRKIRDTALVRYGQRRVSALDA